MRRLRVWWLIAICGALAAGCGSSVTGNDAADGTGSDTIVTDNTPPTDNPPVEDVPPPPDVIVEDSPPIDVVPEDVPPPMDAPGDSILVEDVPPPMDTPPVDVPPPDSGPMCPNGITDACPAVPPGSCPDLGDGRAHTVTFAGFTANMPASCEGTQTSMGPDGVVPLTLTRTSDVTITAMRTGMDAVVIALYPADGCGMQPRELRCSNSSSAPGGVASVRALTLAPGRYWVQVASALGNPAIVQATITPAMPRAPGDVCPGTVVTPDGPAVTQSTMGYSNTPDVGTTCGAGTNTTGYTDAVFSYTLTTARDVTISVSATGAGNVNVDVAPTCGSRGAALPGCASGNPARRTIRNQAPGTYYVTVDYNGGPGRSIIVQVTTAAPTVPPPGDRCPGIALTAGMTSTVNAMALNPDFTLACNPAARADAIWSFPNPPMGQDALVQVQASAAGAVTAMQLQAACGAMNVGPCNAAQRSTVWQRYRGLAPGGMSHVVGSTNMASGMLAARYTLVPAVTPVNVPNNDRCANVADINVNSGGIYTGNTAMFNDDTNLPTPCIPTACGGGVDALYRLDLRMATGPRRVLLSTVGSAFDTVLFVTQGATCPGGTNVPNACNDDYYGNAAAIDVTLPPALYFVVVSGCGVTQRGAYTLDVAFP